MKRDCMIHVFYDDTIVEILRAALQKAHTKMANSQTSTINKSEVVARQANHQFKSLTNNCNLALA